MVARWRHDSPAAPFTADPALDRLGQRLVAEDDVPPHVTRVLNKPPRLHELRSALAELTTTSKLSSLHEPAVTAMSPTQTLAPRPACSLSMTKSRR